MRGMMMKRKTYVVSDEQGNKITKHAWNSALRAVPDLIIPKLEEGETALLIGRQLDKDLIGNYLSGIFTYLTSNRASFKITIEKENE
jgi:hypothetical protein